MVERARLPPSLLLNQVIDDRYKVVRRLGEGGMSYVYQGRDQVTNTDVAIKVLTPAARR